MIRVTLTHVRSLTFLQTPTSLLRFNIVPVVMQIYMDGMGPKLFPVFALTLTLRNIYRYRLRSCKSILCEQEVKCQIHI